MARSNSFKNILRLIEENQEKPVPESFLADLKRGIELLESGHNVLPSKTYKPSSMNCIRSSYYQIMGKTPDIGTSNYISIGICNSGSDIHTRIQSAISNLTQVGISCEYVDISDFVNSRQLKYLDIVKRANPENREYETKLYHRDLNMSFLCDGIICYKNHYYILEIKSESSYKFMTRKDVDPAHYHQATAYSIAFDIPDVLFVYVNRDLLDMKAFLFTPSHEQKMELIGYIDTCDEYVKKMETPPKPEEAGSKFCQYCMYKTQCRKDGG